MRLSVNLAPDVEEALRELADIKHVTIAEVIRDAIATEYFLVNMAKKGSRVYVQSKEGGFMEIVFKDNLP